jgi:glutathione S-transferase
LQPAFLKLNPNGRVPVLRDRENGLVIWESAAIRLYLAEKTGRLQPADPARRWAACSWTLLQATAVGPSQSQANIFSCASSPSACPASSRASMGCRRSE